MQSLLHESISLFSCLRDEIANVIALSKPLDARFSRFANGQMHYFSERCQSTNLLIQDGKLWDGDILMRAATECATRFIFVCIAEPLERTNRMEEYEVSLSEIDELQRSEKAKQYLKVPTNSHSVMLLGGIVLTSEREAELRSRWPRAKRAQLKQKWSFSEMASQLSKFHGSGIDLRYYKSLLHSYGLSSHLIHADQSAIKLFWDRHEREPHVRQLQEQAHFARLCSDQISMLFLCWCAIKFATGRRSENPTLIKRLTAFYELTDRVHRKFADSQAHLYEPGGHQQANYPGR